MGGEGVAQLTSTIYVRLWLITGVIAAFVAAISVLIYLDFLDADEGDWMQGMTRAAMTTVLSIIVWHSLKKNKAGLPRALITYAALVPVFLQYRYGSLKSTLMVCTATTNYFL